MSIVCCKIYDNKIEIASDSITVRGYTQSKGNNTNFSKLVKSNELIIGGVGSAQELGLFQLFCKTRTPKRADEDSILEFMSEFSDWKKKKTDDDGITNSYIIVFQQHAFAINHYFIKEITTYEAIGAGMDYALSALYLEADVQKAVETACELSVYCELPVIKFIVTKS